MANTTNFGWETPDDTDLVKDGAAAMRTLGNAIDTSLVDLKGGTTGQVLSKASNTDMDFTWVAQDDSNAIQNAIVDAKGDLITATAADTPARLAVGTNGQILMADSTTATGLKWAAAGTTFAGASAYNATNVNVANNTDVKISFDSENFDTDGYHSTTTNTSRFTIPSGKAGYYSCVAVANYASNATGYRDVAIMKNGATQGNNRVATISGAQIFVTCSAIFYAAVGDYIELNQYQNSGSTLVASYSNLTIAYLGA